MAPSMKIKTTLVASGCRVLALASLLVLLTIYNDWLIVECKVSRKPPFNGSIFGKRSNLPALAGASIRHQASPSSMDGFHYWLADDFENQLQSIAPEQESIVKDAIYQCLVIQQNPDLIVSYQMEALCSSLLAGFGRNGMQPANSFKPAAPSQLDASSWFGRLLVD